MRLLVALLLTATTAFVAPPPLAARHARVPALRVGPDNDARSALDAVPAFVCCNAAGNPLAYERGGSPTCVFYADVGDAERALAESGAAYPDLGLRLVAVGLGEARERNMAGGAVLVPSQKALAAARSPDGKPWDDFADGLPFFGCLQMTAPRPDGSGSAVPLFADPEDARSALADAKPPERGDDADADGYDLTIVCIGVDRAATLVERGENLMFVPSRAAAAYLRGEPAPPPTPDAPPITQIPGSSFGIEEPPAR